MRHSTLEKSRTGSSVVGDPWVPTTSRVGAGSASAARLRVAARAAAESPATNRRRSIAYFMRHEASGAVLQQRDRVSSRSYDLRGLIGGTWTIDHGSGSSPTGQSIR